MRLLHVIPSISPTEGGPSAAVKSMAAELHRLGFTVDVATTNDNGRGKQLDVPLGRAVEADGVRYFFFPKQTHFYKVSFPLASWLARNAAAYDVIHVHALFSFSSVVAARAALRSGVPYIVRPLGVLSRWGVENRRPGLKALSLKLIELPILRRAAGLHFTSEAERKEAILLSADLAKVPSAVIPLPVAIPGPVDPDKFISRFPEARGRKVVLFLSRLDPKKGLELLLEAFSQLQPACTEALLVIAGDGEARYRADLQQKAKAFGVAENVIWTGHLESSEKAAVFACAKCFVLPSASENFGIAAAEALAAGVPTILSREVGISAEIESYEAGIVVEREAARIAGAISTMLRDLGAAERMSNNGQRLVRERYAPDAVGAALAQLYREVATRADYACPAAR